jgi:predicted cupin superfamily sugar epimerase
MMADEVVSLLGLAPHPEGGWYRETFRDVAASDGRSRSTAIYYLLARGQRSHWHRVDAVEIWHWHAGAALALSICAPDGQPERLILGADLVAAQRPQGIVPQGWWQAAESLGDWSLVGCTVAPGFEFAGFEMAPPGWEPSASRP